LRGEALLGTFTASTPEALPTYEAYSAAHQGADRGGETLIIGAESFTSKSNPSTRLRSERDPAATVYDARYLRLNAIDGWSFRHGNDTVFFTVDVAESGLYHIGFNYRQNYLMQMPVFREITINGEIPFAEAAMVPFHFTNRFERTLLGDDEPFLFHLEAGTHEIGLRVVVEPYRNAYENILTMMDEITELSLEIKRLTGNTVDRYRTWRLVQFIPDIEDRLTRWIDALDVINSELEQYSRHHEPGELTNIRLARRQLETLRSDINNIPNRMLMLADGDASTAQLLGSTAQVLLENGLDLEAMFVTGEDRPPRSGTNVVFRTFESVRRFFLSFTAHDYAAGRADDDVIEIWANYPRQYVEIMQQMIDNEFTDQTGIRVRLALMPDESKLILANAADRAPDIALGVNHWIPYEFAIRGASLDLRQFSGYEDTVAQFAPGVMIPYAFEDGMFGLPLTQNFWVTFYRTDIFEALDLPVPDTWDDVVEILPELQRLGMNYFHPIAFHGGFKPFVATLPFLHQFGGSLYAEDGMSTVINSEANLEGIRLMTELFTLYNLPKQVPNFYNHFRFGTLPIGISDLATYLQLTIAAPEIAGKWDIALHPGVRQDDGSVRRYAASGAQSSMIMSTTQRPDDAWAFLEWWMSTTVQTDFALRLQTTYGTEFLWNTANLEAFAQLPLPPEHIEVILEQWNYAIEASRIPGAYMVEREISNAWNRIVFEDANPRITLDRAVRIANREILFRMEEFDYVLEGQVIRPYRVPTIETIHAWLKEHNDD
ncbi:MAG: extracellular solute-binding protein, partial [Acholeplasmatales bacterium]